MLAIDVGATRTRVRVEEIASREEILHAEFESGSLDDFVKTLKETLGSLIKRVKVCAIGVAGRVDRERKRCSPTFLDWGEGVPIVKIINAMGIPRVYLMNDLEAGVHGIDSLEENRTIQIAGSLYKPEPDAPLVLGMPGTGCGIGYRDKEGVVRPSEGGGNLVHLDPSSQFEIELLRSIQEEIGGPPCYDYLVSGGGIKRIMNLLLKERGRNDYPEELPSSIISKMALEGDPLCREAIEIFCRFFARCMQGAVLITLAPVLYLGGSIVDANHPLLKESFPTHFANHPHHKTFLSDIPILLIVNEPNLNLLGAVKVALKNA